MHVVLNCWEYGSICVHWYCRGVASRKSLPAQGPTGLEPRVWGTLGRRSGKQPVTPHPVTYTPLTSSTANRTCARRALRLRTSSPTRSWMGRVGASSGESARRWRLMRGANVQPCTHSKHNQHSESETGLGKRMRGGKRTGSAAVVAACHRLVGACTPGLHAARPIVVPPPAAPWRPSPPAASPACSACRCGRPAA